MIERQNNVMHDRKKQEKNHEEILRKVVILHVITMTFLIQIYLFCIMLMMIIYSW